MIMRVSIVQPYLLTTRYQKRNSLVFGIGQTSPFSTFSRSCRNLCRTTTTTSHSITKHASTPTTSSSDVPVWRPQLDSLTLTEYGLEQVFYWDLPEGRCLGLYLDANTTKLPITNEAIEQNKNHWIYSMLHPKEIEYGLSKQLNNNVLENFFLGRLAMREAFRLEGVELCKDEDECIILKDDHNRPIVPTGQLGSITHKDKIGVALVASSTCDNGNDSRSTDSNDYNTFHGIGVDLEEVSERRQSISRRILTDNELDQLGQVDGVSKEEEVLLRFSLKESWYKAVHPLICQYVNFKEAEVKPHSDGTASVFWNLTSGAHEKISGCTGHWKRFVHERTGKSFFLTSASVTVNDGTEKQIV